MPFPSGMNVAGAASIGALGGFGYRSGAALPSQAIEMADVSALLPASSKPGEF